MKLFLDSANLHEIKECLHRGFLTGITTNPSILSKEPQTEFVGHIRKIAAACRTAGKLLPLSVEVFTHDPEDMYRQAKELADSIGYERLNIKIPIGWDELKVIERLTKEGIHVNCTCIFTEAQCVMAANSGAAFVSIFMCRLKDIGGDPVKVISNTRELLEASSSKAEIIAGSIRHATDVLDAHVAGAHIVTTSYSVMQAMCSHPQTTKSVQGFLADFARWLKPIQEPEDAEIPSL